MGVSQTLFLSVVFNRYASLPATDDPIYGNKEGGFFHGYYGHYCYLPLYIFTGEHLPWAGGGGRSTVDAADGAVDERSRSRPRARRPSSGRASSCRVRAGRRVRRKQSRGRGWLGRRCPRPAGRRAAGPATGSHPPLRHEGEGAFLPAPSCVLFHVVFYVLHTPNERAWLELRTRQRAFSQEGGEHLWLVCPERVYATN